jgi:DNA-binding beta-propeller fold protein YncE
LRKLNYFEIILIMIVTLLFLTSSAINVGASSSPAAISNTINASKVNCRTSVCAYIKVSTAVSIVYDKRAIKTVQTAYAPAGQEGWDYVSGIVVVPAEAYPGSVELINASSNTILSVLKGKNLSECPDGALYNPIRNEVLVSLACSDKLAVINATSWKVEPNTIVVGSNQQPTFLAYNPLNQEIYVSLFTHDFDYCGDNVSVFSAATDKLIKTVGVGSGPSGISVNLSNNETYVGNHCAGTVSVLNLDNKVIKTISGFASPNGLNYGEGKVYVCDGSNSVFIISSSNKIRQVSGFNSSTVAGAYDPANGYEYVALGGLYDQILFGTRILPQKIYEPLSPSDAIITTATPG